MFNTRFGTHAANTCPRGSGVAEERFHCYCASLSRAVIAPVISVENPRRAEAYCEVEAKKAQCVGGADRRAREPATMFLVTL